MMEYTTTISVGARAICQGWKFNKIICGIIGAGVMMMSGAPASAQLFVGL